MHTTIQVSMSDFEKDRQKEYQRRVLDLLGDDSDRIDGKGKNSLNTQVPSLFRVATLFIYTFCI